MSERAPRRSAGWRTHAFAVVALTLVTGAAWIASVPPFEGPDELFFYNRARQFTEEPERREALLFRLSAPIIRVMSPGAGYVAPEYNPAFRFISNLRGEVNRFVHDRAVAPRDHVRTLMTVRVVIVLLNAATMLLIYASARLVLDDGWLALLVTSICLWIPQSSFMNAVIHPEVITRLLAAAVTLIVVAGATRRAPWWLLWLALPLSIAVVPLADRQALFLAPFAAISLVVVTRSWKGRVLAAVVVVVPLAIAAWVVTQYTEAGTSLGPWISLAFHPLRPFLEADAGLGSTPPDLAYYAFEFLPKMFTGFWGWLGQPSILLPAWSYAVLLVLTAVALAGLVSRLAGPSPESDEERGRFTARVLLAIGVALMCLPIVYGPAIAGRNLWYGRWLFAMLGPLAIGLVLGVGGFVAVARRRPYQIAVVVAVVAAVAAALWGMTPGDALRTAIRIHHFGDVQRFSDTVRDVPIALAALAILIAASARLPARRAALPVVPALCVAIAFVNAITLTALIRPLYAPLSEDEYAGMIAKYLATFDTIRAAQLYGSAVKSYPASGALRRLADENPRLLLGGTSPASRALLWDRLARGKGLDDRDALLMLAHEARESGAGDEWRTSGALKAALSKAEQQPDLAEPVALARLAITDDAADPDAARRPIGAGRGRRIASPVRSGEIVIEGFTVHPAPAGRTQLIVYFRPSVPSTSRRLWLHAYPVGSPAYLDVEPTIAPTVWKPGSLTWETFDLPPGAFTTYVGIWVGTDLGVGAELGVIP